MKETLRPGLAGIFRYTVPDNRTVPHMYPEAPDFQLMPGVLATGYLVALCEWAAIELIKPHLDWPAEQSLGTHVNLSHLAATPPGLTVELSVSLTAVADRKLTFALRAADGIDLISEGTHERHLIDAARFNARIAAKVARLREGARA
jgi:fluoroacetyl-CoA thioesterase